ncbi:hypothetical protein ACFYPC_00275 [Streptomyces sp. NPDC005808]|uniref:hypothetical protein n=1 Tax=Streptomyces sp. NPDC005808 TaxID=3364734 RepID=UPI00367891E5
MEVADLVTYFNEQLVAEYRYPEVPHARMHDLATYVERGFGHGFTAGQDRHKPETLPAPRGGQ